MTKAKLYTVFFTCLLGLWLLLPSLNFNLGWPQKKLTLGLDLVGGVHLVFEIDEQKHKQELLQHSLADIRDTLRKNKTFFKNLKIADNKITFEETSSGGKALETLSNSKDLYNFERKDQLNIISLNPAFIANSLQNDLQRSTDVIRKRIDEHGTIEPVIQTQGSSRIVVQLPGEQNIDEVKAILGKTAKLTFSWIKEGPFNSASDNSLTDDKNARPLPGESGHWLVDREVLLSGQSLKHASVQLDNAKPIVSIAFDTLGTKKFAELTSDSYIGHRLGIIVDNYVLSAPNIRDHITNGKAVITGDFSLAEAETLAKAIRSGALPAELNIVEEKTIGSELGRDYVVHGVIAALSAVFIVSVFMIYYYSWVGLTAVIAILINIMLILASMVLLGATLTLPGIAGIALTVGMAVDANVLINERIKDELRMKVIPLKAINTGYKSAFTTIVDANLTTAIGALCLYLLGLGPVRGFAVTILLGIISSLFTSVYVTQALLSLYTHYKKRITYLAI